jgi:hypothetical protein
MRSIQTVGFEVIEQIQDGLRRFAVETSVGDSRN